MGFPSSFLVCDFSRKVATYIDLVFFIALCVFKRFFKCTVDEVSLKCKIYINSVLPHLCFWRVGVHGYSGMHGLLKPEVATKPLLLWYLVLEWWILGVVKVVNFLQKMYVF